MTDFIVREGHIVVINFKQKSLSVCSSLVLDVVEKQSTCELEVDAVAADILNHFDMQSKTMLDDIQIQWIGCGVVLLHWPPFTGNMAC